MSQMKRVTGFAILQHRAYAGAQPPRVRPKCQDIPERMQHRFAPAKGRPRRLKNGGAGSKVVELSPFALEQVFQPLPKAAALRLRRRCWQVFRTVGGGNARGMSLGG